MDEAPGLHDASRISSGESRAADGHEESPAARRAWDLIPWVVAGTASAEDRALVEAHTQHCADCSAELAFHRKVRAGMLASAAPAVDAEPGLQRLWARIDAAEDARAPSTSPPPSPQAWPELSAARGRPRWNWTPLLAAAVAVQAVGLVALSRMLPTAPQYQTLSQANPVASNARLRLVLDGNLKLRDAQALLARHRLRIVDSNPEGTILGLLPVTGSTVPAEPWPGMLLDRLRAEPGVLLAEPVTLSAAAGVAR